MADCSFPHQSFHQGFPYEIDAAEAEHTPPRIGLIVLKVDEVIEHEFRQALSPSLAKLHISRIPSHAEVTPEHLREMAADLPHAAALFPPAARFSATAYACTSAATVIGPPEVARLIATGMRTDVVTDPLSAAIAAFRALGTQRLRLLTPYIPSVAAPLCDAFKAAGMTIRMSLSFGIADDATVARISYASIDAAVRQLCAPSAMHLPIEGAKEGALGNGHEAVFISCTNLRSLALIPRLEAELGCPVLSSNSCLAWHSARLAGITAQLPALGQLGAIPMRAG